MDKKDFKPIYRARFSSGGVLQNELFPRHIDRLMMAIEFMALGEKSAVESVLAGLYKLTPPFQKFFINYDEMMSKLIRCRSLLMEWRSRKMQGWNITLEKELIDVYRLWWKGFNESNLGLEYEKYRDKTADIRKAIIGSG